jgi:hypothetical protein
MRVVQEVSDKLENLGIKSLKLSTGEEIFAELYVYKKETEEKANIFDHDPMLSFFFLKCPLVIYQRENEKDIEKTMFPWTNFLSNTLKSEFVVIGKQFVIGYDDGFPDAVEAWKSLSEKYTTATEAKLKGEA